MLLKPNITFFSIYCNSASGDDIVNLAMMISKITNIGKDETVSSGKAIITTSVSYFEQFGKGKYDMMLKIQSLKPQYIVH